MKIEIVDARNEEVVKEIDVSYKTPSQIDRVISGIEINLSENFYTRINFKEQK